MMANTPDFLIKIIHKLEKEGFEVYIVGGAVRDLLLGKPVDDWDLTTNARPEEILKLFKDAYYNNKFGTVGIADRSSPNPYEITTFRKEIGYSDKRHPDKIEWGETLEEDLARRDFTINAMALGRVKEQEGKKVKEGGKKAFTLPLFHSFTLKLIDPYNGQKDLKAKLIRAVGNANERFAEDALRMMRAVRFAAELNFKIEKDTLAAIKENVQLLDYVAAERVRDELLKLLASPHPSQGVERLRETKILEHVLPELEKCFGVDQKSTGRHHIYDVGTHLLMSLKYCPSQDPIVRLATLLHDIGKPETYKKRGGTITFYNHEVVGSRITRDISKRLRLSKKQSEKLFRLVRWHQFTVDEKQTDAAIRRFIRRVGKENINDMLDLRTGDRLGGGAAETSWRTEEFKKRLVEVQKQPFTVHDLKIDGTDVMKELNLNPGPKVGEVLNEIFKRVENKELENTKKELLKALRLLKH